MHKNTSILGTILTIIFLPIIIPIAVISGVSTGLKSKPKKKSPYTEKEMDAYGLNEEEKELVRNGEFDPWDFDYLATEDDDFYNDK